MEGYTVEEAATVLGVPEGRVWELLARGVLAGTPAEGGGMRVHLRGVPSAVSERPASPEPAARTRPSDGHGNGTRAGEHPDPEVSPFRELLTEFRNLTERYGQALLALGEARGEVAGLRARVEVLETRLDLRLPGPPGWPVPQAAPEPAPAALEPAPDAPAAPEPAPAAAEPAPAAAEGPSAPSGEPAIPAMPPTEAGGTGESADGEKARRPHRRRGRSRSGISGIAEALARADDPSVGTLPGAHDAGEAFAELERELSGQAAAAPAPAVALEAAEPEPPEPVAAGERPDGEAPAPAPLQAPGPEERHGDEPSTEAAPMEAAATAAEEGPAAPQQTEPEEAPAAVSGPPEAEPSSGADRSTGWDEPDWIAEEDLEPVREPSEQPAGSEQTAGPEQHDAIEPSAPTPAADDASTPDDDASTRDEEPAEAAVDMADWPVPTEDEEAEPIAAQAVFPSEAPAPADSSRAASEPAAGDQVEAEAEVQPEPEAVQAEAVVPWPAAEAVPVVEPESEPEPEPEPMAVSAWGDEPPIEMSDELLLHEPRPKTPGPAGEMPAAAAQPGAPSTAETAESDASEEELMWLGDEFRPSTSAWQGLGEPFGAPAAPAESSAQEAELDRLARLRGWDESELSAIRSLLDAHPDRGGAPLPESPPAEGTPDPEAEPEPEPERWAKGATEPPGTTVGLPGADELEQAMAALAGGRPAELPAEPASNERPDPDDVGHDGAEPAAAQPAPAQPVAAIEPGPVAAAADDAESQDAGSREADAQAASADSPSVADAPVPAPQPTSPDRPAYPDPRSFVLRDTEQGPHEDWLRGRRGAAAIAYRRLRRLFPG